VLARSSRQKACRCHFVVLNQDPTVSLRRAERFQLAIRHLVRDFNDYFGAGALGGTSQLYHLVATEHLRSLISQTYCGPLYTMQLR
jgi:hypothetical protein